MTMFLLIGAGLVLLTYARRQPGGILGGQEPGQNPGSPSTTTAPDSPALNPWDYYPDFEPLTREQCATWGGLFNNPPTPQQAYCWTTFRDLYPADPPAQCEPTGAGGTICFDPEPGFTPYLPPPPPSPDQPIIVLPGVPIPDWYDKPDDLISGSTPIVVRIPRIA